MERGEVDGRCMVWGSIDVTHPDWVSGNKLRYLLQVSLSKNPKLSNVPFLLDLIDNEIDRNAARLVFADQEVGLPVIAPPGADPAVVRQLRDALTATLADKDFLADAKTLQLTIQPVTGADTQKLIQSVFSAPASVVERARNLVSVIP